LQARADAVPNRDYDHACLFQVRLDARNSSGHRDRTPVIEGPHGVDRVASNHEESRGRIRAPDRRENVPRKEGHRVDVRRVAHLTDEKQEAFVAPTGSRGQRLQGLYAVWYYPHAWAAADCLAVQLRAD